MGRGQPGPVSKGTLVAIERDHWAIGVWVGCGYQRETDTTEVDATGRNRTGGRETITKQGKAGEKEIQGQLRQSLNKQMRGKDAKSSQGLPSAEWPENVGLSPTISLD